MMGKTKVRQRPAPELGEYRCYWPNPWDRPCNKFLGSGSGEFARRCPRCKRQCAFENPNYPRQRQHGVDVS